MAETWQKAKNLVKSWLNNIKAQKKGFFPFLRPKAERENGKINQALLKGFFCTLERGES
jgi:hypothetical protein